MRSAGPDAEGWRIDLQEKATESESTFARFDTVLMGRQTYEQVKAMGGGVPLLAAGARAELRRTGPKLDQSGIASLEYAVEADRAKG